MEKEVKLVRVLDASPERLWRVWTDPEELKEWWGPNNVTIPECEVDLRVGGRFYIVMEAGEGMGEYKGTLWPMEAEFTEVTPNEKLAYKGHAWTEGPAKEDFMIDQGTEVTFSEEGSKTRVTVMAKIYKTGPKAGMAAEGMEYGFNQQLDKLGAFLGAK